MREIILCRYAVCVIYRYVLWYKKGYQEFDKLVSATTTKVKGVAFTRYYAPRGIRVWDTADYVIPPQVNPFCS